MKKLLALLLALCLSLSLVSAFADAELDLEEEAATGDPAFYLIYNLLTDETDVNPITPLGEPSGYQDASQFAEDNVLYLYLSETAHTIMLIGNYTDSDWAAVIWEIDEEEDWLYLYYLYTFSSTYDVVTEDMTASAFAILYIYGEGDDDYLKVSSSENAAAMVQIIDNTFADDDEGAAE